MGREEQLEATDISASYVERSSPVLRPVLTTALLVTTALGFIGAAGAGIIALHVRAAADLQQTLPPPVAVATVSVVIEDGYEATSRYVGRLEPARQTALAFERDGLVLAVDKEEGDRVAAGESVAQLDTARLKARRQQLEARRRELMARRDLARLTRDRQSTLRTRGWSAEQRLDEARASLAQLVAAIEQVTAQIAALDIDIAKSRLIAPFDGIVAARQIDEGAVVAAGTPLLTLMGTRRRQVRVGLPPEVAADLDGQRSYLFESPQGSVRGQLVARRPDLQTGTRTVTALFNLNEGADIPFGEIVTLTIKQQVKSRGAWLPLAALKEGRRGLWTVLTVNDDNGERRVAREAVEILHIDGRRVFVRGTFKPGASIISVGTNRVVTGQRVARARE